MAAVVVGVDDSTEAVAALGWAVAYAEAHGVPLTLMTVLDRLELTALWSERPEDNVAAAHQDAARQAIAELVSRVEGDRGHEIQVPVEIKVVVGHAVKSLTEAAADGDLLVVGSRGAGGFSSLRLGSVSSGVARHARCSVVIVRGSATG